MESGRRGFEQEPSLREDFFVYIAQLRGLRTAPTLVEREQMRVKAFALATKIITAPTIEKATLISPFEALLRVDIDIARDAVGMLKVAKKIQTIVRVVQIRPR